MVASEGDVEGAGVAGGRGESAGAVGDGREAAGGGDVAGEQKREKRHMRGG